MGAKKVKIAKDWFQSGDKPHEKRAEDLFEQTGIIRVEDLPRWLSAVEAAPHLKVEPKYAWELMKKQTVRSTKIGGRRFTTPEWIADYLRREMKENG